jgi:hypothetical protein
MMRWINEYIIDHKICPFAKKSSYEVHVWPFDNLEGANARLQHCNIMEFFHERVRSLSAKQKEGVVRPNEFVCFPYISEFEDYDTFRAFYLFFMETQETVGGDFDVHNSEIDAQAFLFHPEAKGNKNDPNAANFRFRSPWPTFHIISKKDLDKERKGSDGVGRNIFLRNERKFQDPKSKRNFEDILETFRADR